MINILKCTKINSCLVEYFNVAIKSYADYKKNMKKI